MQDLYKDCLRLAVDAASSRMAHSKETGTAPVPAMEAKTAVELHTGQQLDEAERQMEVRMDDFKKRYTHLQAQRQAAATALAGLQKHRQQEERAHDAGDTLPGRDMGSGGGTASGNGAPLGSA